MRVKLRRVSSSFVLLDVFLAWLKSRLALSQFMSNQSFSGFVCFILLLSVVENVFPKVSKAVS